MRWVGRSHHTSQLCRGVKGGTLACGLSLGNDERIWCMCKLFAAMLCAAMQACQAHCRACRLQPHKASPLTHQVEAHVLQVGGGTVLCVSDCPVCLLVAMLG